MKDIPNLLTIFRIFSIPIIIMVLYFDSQHSSIIAASMFLIASLTDFFDGYLARMWRAQSVFGKLFDPIADKLIITSAIMMLIYKGKITDINVIMAIIVVAREIFVSGIREFAASINLPIAVSQLGKIKTVLQIISVAALILGNNGSFFHVLGIIALWISAIIGIISSYKYSKHIFRSA